MSDTIGNITVPAILASGTFPIVPDYGYGQAQHPDLAIHQFGSGNAKIEQRFLLGAVAKRFTVRRAFLRDADRRALRDFWEQKYGPYGAFTYNAPSDDGNGTTAFICRFANEPLSWEMLADHACSLGVTLVEIPASNPTYTLASTVTRFPPDALKTALLLQVQQMIPLIKIQPLQSGYPAIYLSDRRCTVGSQLYLPRLVDFDGISQGMGNEADDATFTFGNADRVMRDLANDVDLFRATIEFSLYHVGQQIKLDLWKGDIINWQFDSGAEFKVTAADGLYELNLPYPSRKVSRSCWKAFNVGACPFSTAGAMDLVHFPSADSSKCDKGYDTANGCLAHGMKRYYGAVIAEPQGVTIKDNSTGVFGFGRSSITSVSLVSDSIYDQVIPEIYTDSEMPVNCKVAAGRDESDFYEALGIVGEGPLISYTPAHYEDLNGNPVSMGSTGAVFIGSTLDGQAQHGWPNQPTYGIRQVLGADPAADGDWFSLDQSGNTAGGDWRKVYSGNSTYKDNYAAGTAFMVIRRSDTKGLQLTKPGDHAMVAYVQQGMSGWAWTSPGARVFGPPLVNPVWIAINMLLRARGLRLGADATTPQLDLAETFFDVQAAIDAAAICDEQVTALVGTGSETQFKFRGVLQEEKPLRDWLQEVLMNCLAYYTFSFGKLKIGVRENSSTVEAFTIGNIVFNSLQLAPLKPSFDHLTANFADQDYKFVNNSVTVYDIDRATLQGGAAGPLFLKSNVNLSGTCTKSQAARIISIRLREELGGTSIAEWKAARQLVFRTTVLALNTEPGMVCSMTHPDMPGGAGEFRVSSWKLNKDYSIDIQGRTTTDSMYDLATGPKPADVNASPVPDESFYDTGVPGAVTGTPVLGDYGTFAVDNLVVLPDASGNENVAGATGIILAAYYVDELTTDLWASLEEALDESTDPATVNCTVNPDTPRSFKSGDFIVFNDEAADSNHSGRRSYECAQITDITGGQFTFQRAYPGVPTGQATFGTLRCAHRKHVRFYKLDMRIFGLAVRKGFFRTPGLPARVEGTIPSACIVATLVGVANHFGWGPFTVWPLSHHNEPFMPGDRTCSGGAYTFQIPGPLSVQDNVTIPMKVQDAASIRCVYAYLQQGTSDGTSAFAVKCSKDGGATWNVLEAMGIAQNAGTPFTNTWDYLVSQGYGLPETRRLPYNDYGLVTTSAITGSGSVQTISTASYDASTEALIVGRFVFLDLGGGAEECVEVIAADPENQTFDAIVSKNHPDGTQIRPCIWPTPVLLEGNDLGFDIKDVASPDAGSDLTIVIQT